MSILYPQSNLTFFNGQTGKSTVKLLKKEQQLLKYYRQSQTVLGLGKKMGTGSLYLGSNLTCDLSVKVKQVGQRSNYQSKSPITPQILEISSQLQCIGVRQKSVYGCLISKVNFDLYPFLQGQTGTGRSNVKLSKSPITP